MINGYKLGAGLNYWDEPLGLINLLKQPNFYINMDVIYVIDGRYIGRDDESQTDPRYIEAIIESYPKIHYVKMYDVKQIEKRNKYWELAERDNLDFMIVVDSDETIRLDGDFKESLDQCMKEKEQCFPIVMEYTPSLEMPRPRLFKKPFNFRHRDKTGTTSISHGSLYSPEGKEIIQQIQEFFNKNGKLTGVKGAYMTHDKSLKTKIRIDMDYKYYENNPNR